MTRPKDVLRAELKQQRQRLTDAEVQAASEAAIEWCVALWSRWNVRTLHTYLPNAKQREIDTWGLIKQARQQFAAVQVLVPKVYTDILQTYLLEQTTVVRESALGIPEPVQAALLPHVQPDVVIVPVLGFTKMGYRLGYGKGYYDRFLADLPPRCKLIGLAYDEAEAAFTPEPHDVPLHYIVTPNRVVAYNKSL